MELDHVLIAVTDLTTAAREIEARYGLTSIDGGRHPGWGTANRIVPLDQTYLELLAVVDEAKASHSTFGRWVGTADPKVGRLLGWAVRTRELDDVAQRLGLPVRPGSRDAPSGAVLRWRTAGIEQAALEPWLPFFIEWGPGTPFPGSATVTHSMGRVETEKLSIDGDADRLAAWLGDHGLPIAVNTGTSGVARVVLSGETGKIILSADLS